MNQSFDFRLSESWNNIHPYSKTVPEQFWDICRILTAKDFLEPDQGAVSAIKIGPFNIATNIDISQKDFLFFFVESIFPALVTEVTEMTFDEVYPLYFIPAFKILTYILEHSFIIKDPLQWKILIYIKNANENNVFPTVSEILKEFVGFDESEKIKDSIYSLQNVENNFGTQSPIIFIDDTECIHSLV